MFDLSKDNVARFQAASPWRARWQVINSFVPYALLWIAMDRALAVSYWLMLPLAILAAGFLARIFIIFHDCGHGSFFRVQTRQRGDGCHRGLAESDALSTLALATCLTSWDRRRSGSARLGRYLDADGARISAKYALGAVSPIGSRAIRSCFL